MIIKSLISERNLGPLTLAGLNEFLVYLDSHFVLSTDPVSVTETEFNVMQPNGIYIAPPPALFSAVASDSNAV